MKVLYFHQHFTTRSGSSGTRSYEFARALIARGHQVTMVCGQSDQSGLDLPFDTNRNWRRGVVDGIDVIALPVAYSNRATISQRVLLFAKFALRSVLIALRHDFDILFATSTPLTAGIPGIVMKLAGRRRKFVFEVRDLWPELPRALGMRNPFLLSAMSLLEWMSYRTADACVGLSPGIVDGIKRRSRRTLPVEMVPNGCDLDLFTPTKRTKPSLPGVLPGNFVAGFTGAHGIANGLDAVLDAAKELEALGRTDIKLVLIGDGNQKDRLVRRAKAERLSSVVFLPAVKKLEIATVTASFDCGLMVLSNVPAFYYGTSPNKFFDYIAAGVPVVNNYPGWLADLITWHECGIPVRPSDPRAFAQALIRLADDPEARRQMGVRARRLAEEEFARDALATKFVNFVTRSPGPQSAIP